MKSTKRWKETAARFGILDRMEALEQAILQVHHTPDVDFDIDVYEDLYQIIAIPHYTISVQDDDCNYLRKSNLLGIIGACLKHDLHGSGDRIEDYGEHWYLVFNAGSSWPMAS